MFRAYLCIVLVVIFAGCGPAVVDGDQGANGLDGAPGVNGSNGQSGTPGPTGSAGVPGKSCSVKQLSNGALITCSDGTSATILNGEACKGKKN